MRKRRRQAAPSNAGLADRMPSFSVTLMPELQATSSRLADKAALQFGEPIEGRARQRTLVDRACGKFEVVERRVADQHGRYGVIGDHETQSRVDQVLGMAFADQRLDPLRALDIGAVAAAGTDRLDA